MNTAILTKYLLDIQEPQRLNAWLFISLSPIIHGHSWDSIKLLEKTEDGHPRVENQESVTPFVTRRSRSIRLNTISVL